MNFVFNRKSPLALFSCPCVKCHLSTNHSGINVPESYGGIEMDKVTSALASFALALSAHTCIGARPLVWYDSVALGRQIARHVIEAG